jgi:hypothetical protein
VTPAQARKIALSYEGAYERIGQGGPEIRIVDKFFLRVGTREPDTVMFATASFEERDMLIEASPGTFYVTDHFKTYEGAPARVAKLDAKTLRGLLDRRLKALKP